MSLAAFMGGRATGPRLNKPAPQKDAHDPTQFDQRVVKDLSPHPIFGTGGVAMPGMAARGKSAPAVASSMVQRDLSTQGIRGAIGQTTPLTTPMKSIGMSKPAPQESTPIRMSPSPSLSLYSTPAAVPAKPSYTPVTSARPSSVSPPISVPSLMRPIHPQPRSPPTSGPQIPASKNPSPAFLKPEQTKELTPSLSRLQGRGFVQSLVKLSSELEASSSPGRPASGAVSATPTPERPVKVSSAVERWQTQQVPSSPTSSPSPSFTAPALRKAKTVDESMMDSAGGSKAVRKPATLPKPTLKSAVSQPALMDAAKTTQQMSPPPMSLPKGKAIFDPTPSPAIPRIGSANTLFSYIKPTKTGDDPLPDVRGHSSPPQPEPKAAGPHSEVDELGMRTTWVKAEARPLSHVRAFW